MTLPSVFHFYIDDSGSRDPDKSRTTDPNLVDWFGLGGIIVHERHIEEVERRVREFRFEWPHPEAPLHSWEIRTQKKGFAWMRHASASQRAKFMSELTELMCSLPIIVHATVVDRPGYNKRYLLEYGPRRWRLCRTAFNIVVERAAKFASAEQSRLRIFVEQSDKKTEAGLKGYFDGMRSKGLPFDPATSAKYAPFGQAELSRTLLEFRVKSKSSVLMQLADLALWPVCKGRYADNLALTALKNRGKLLDSLCNPENGLQGIKYSCFDT